MLTQAWLHTSILTTHDCAAVSWSYYYTPSVTYTLEVLISTLLSHTGKLLAVLPTCRSDLESGNYIQQHFKPAASSTCVIQRRGKLGFDLFDISASTILIWTICISNRTSQFDMRVQKWQPSRQERKSYNCCGTIFNLQLARLNGQLWSIMCFLRFYCKLHALFFSEV